MAVSEDEEVIPDVIVAVMLVGDVIALTLIFLILMMAIHLVIKRKRPNWCYPKMPKSVPKIVPKMGKITSLGWISIYIMHGMALFCTDVYNGVLFDIEYGLLSNFQFYGQNYQYCHKMGKITFWSLISTYMMHGIAIFA